jgi:hypothetical protein
MKTCTKCHIPKNLDEFVQDKRKLNGKGAICKPCHTQRGKEYKQANPDKMKAYFRNNHLKTTYGITSIEYDIKAKEQDNLCAICKKPEAIGKNLAVDHSHATGNVRGLLCRACNYALGIFEDDILKLESAIAYLKKYSGKV